MLGMKGESGEKSESWSRMFMGKGEAWREYRTETTSTLNAADRFISTDAPCSIAKIGKARPKRSQL